MNETQADILNINQVQLLLAEKRTSLAVMRTVPPMPGRCWRR